MRMSHDDKCADAENRDATTRRTVLKAVSAGAALGVGLGATGSAAAHTAGLSAAHEQLKSSYLGAGATKQAFLDHAGDVLGTLAERGFLERGSVSELPLETFQAPGEYASGDGVHVTAVEQSGVDTAHIVVSKETPTHEVEIVVQPELDRAYARATEKSDGTTSYFTPHRDLSPEGYCWWETDCKAECCVVDGDCRATQYERECCDQAGVTDCDYWSPTGNCC